MKQIKLLKDTLEAAKVELEGLEKDNHWFVSQVVEDIEACLAILGEGLETTA